MNWYPVHSLLYRSSRVHPLLFIFSSVFIYACACCIFFFFSACTSLISCLIRISYVLNLFGFSLFFYIFCSLCVCIISRIALVHHGRGLDVKKNLSLIHYPCEIKFIHSFSLSLSLSEGIQMMSIKWLTLESNNFFFFLKHKYLTATYFTNYFFRHFIFKLCIKGNSNLTKCTCSQ